MRCSAALLLAVYAVAGNPNSLPYRYWSSTSSPRAQLPRKHVPLPSGNLIARISLGAIAFAVGVALYTGLSTVYLFVPAIAVAPASYIERLRQNRLKAIEAKMDGFILTLANALKSTPSIGTRARLLPAALERSPRRGGRARAERDARRQHRGPGAPEH